MKIGMFDSGMGGLVLLHKAMQTYSAEEYIYYADLDNVPYGEKTNEQILSYALKASEFMEGKECDAIVVACNTATSVAIKTLRNTFSIPIIGVEPAVKPAVTHKGHLKAIVMATPVTVREAKLHDLITSLDAQDDVTLLAMPELVKIAEREDFASDAAKNYILKQLSGVDFDEYSDLVLGCTHFNYFKDTLSEILPKHISIIDGSGGTVHHMADLLGLAERAGKADFSLFTTGGKKADTALIQKAARMLSRLDKLDTITSGKKAQ